METVTYKDLNVHQRINNKANRIVLFRRPITKTLIALIKDRHPDMFGYKKMLLESPGIHNNRNYDGPHEVDYDAPSSGEIAERQHRIQREVK